MFWRVHHRGVLSTYTLTSWLHATFICFKNWISWWLPCNSKLLNMNDSITILNLLTNSHYFVLVHWPNFIKSILVTFFKTLKLFLEHKIIICEFFISFGLFLVIRFVLHLQVFRSFNYLPQSILSFSFALLKFLYFLGINLLSLSKDIVIKLKFLWIQLENSLHILHTLLKDLHFLLELNLLISLVICMSRLEIL